MLKQTENLLILDNAKKENCTNKPYPYFYQEEILPQGLCKDLVTNYPNYDLVSKGNWEKNNFRFNFSTIDVLQNENKIPKIWYDFIKANASQAFFNSFTSLFEEELLTRYPTLGKTKQDLERLKVGIRKMDSFSTHDVLLDIQIAGNTPVQSSKSVRERHIDDPRKIFGALLYLRLDDDDSVGGELEISESKGKKFKFYNNVYIHDKYSKTSKMVPYKKNNFVLFLNSPLSWHGVTQRQPTKFPRLFVNVIAEVKEPLFGIKQYQDKLDHFLASLKIRSYNKY